MDTMSTVEAVERTPSGAFKITFLGDAVAGTFDEEIGALAEKLVGDDNANPVAVVFEKRDGKVFVKAMKEILPPEELGGPAEEEGASESAPVERDAEQPSAATPETEAEETLVETLTKFSDEELLEELLARARP